MPENYFGAEIAARYDQDHGATVPETLAQTVDRLAELAAGSAVLEFAIGTGRVALPLAARGLAVSGIELSAAMVQEMRKKPGGDAIPVTVGDMTSTRVEGQFGLVVLVFNTIDNLTSQEAQVACFQNAAAHLTPGGRFVIETLVPPLQDLPFGTTMRAFAADDHHLGTDTFDVVTQAYTSHHMWRDGDGDRALSVPFRYAWPAELDLMAHISGLALESRWADWDKSAFTRYSRKHISVWRKAH